MACPINLGTNGSVPVYGPYARAPVLLAPKGTICCDALLRGVQVRKISSPC